MRTVSANNSAILAGGARQIAHRLSVKDAGGTYRDLSTYAGVNLIEEISWGENLDDPGLTWSAALTREQESISLAPLMQTSPLNRGFDPAASYAPLLQVGRLMKVEYSMQGEDDPRSRSWALAFGGYIDSIDSAGDTLKLQGRGLEALIVNTFIQRERIYAYAQGSNATKGCLIWSPSTVWALGDRLIPTDSRVNGHFYRVTTAGTGAATEPTWPTGGGSTVTNGGAVFTESGAVSTSTGTALETVLQQILDDNLGTGVVTLWCPVSPSWAVQWFKITRQSTFDEMKALADQIGWCLRYMDDAGTPKLKLFDPLRSTTTSLRSFAPTQVEEYRRLSVEWQGIRNIIRVIYGDSQHLDAGGNPTRKTVERIDAASLTKYGELFAEVSEASNSNIDTATEATTLADAVLSDLAEPEADMEAALLFFFAFVEICDLYTMTADGVHFDANQKLAVVGFDHRVTADEQSTTLRLRGKPASNGRKGWFERLSDAHGGEHHALGVVENVKATALTADTTPVGGVRFDFDWNGTKSPKDTHFELHLSDSPAFTADDTTLVQSGKEKSVEVANLDPGFPLYAQLIPITWNAGRPVRGQPSEEISFTPGRAQATHLNPNVGWGNLPLNGSFETQLDPSAIPDFWLTSAGATWGTQVLLGTSGGLSGANFIKLKTTGVSDEGVILSAEFSVNELKSYAASIWRKTVAGSATTIDWGIYWIASDHSNIGQDVESFSITDQVGSWVRQDLKSMLPPADTRFARIIVALNSGAAGKEVHIDSVQFDVEERWHNVGGSGEPAFANSWVAFGSNYPGPRFKRTPDGWVILSGLAKNGTITAAMFTLPTGYRPKTAEYVYQTVVSNNTVGVVEVRSNGDVVTTVGNNASFSLEGVRFKVD